jgi:uncharacterized protein YydD (DUF2326 family)
MFKLIKLYSNDNLFKEISFKDGINLICGERSVNDEGSVESDKQNGVGKSYVIDLINFCLLKRQNESKVSDIPDEHLPKDSYVYLHFSFNNRNYIFARNKNNDVKIKIESNDFKQYEFGVAGKELTRILNFSDSLLSARDYINFIIKEEDYNYKDFVKLYTSNYTDLLKIHFYFFGLPVIALNAIKTSFKKNKEATTSIRNIKKELDKKNLNIDEIRALQNQIKSDIEKAEKELNYDELTQKIKDESDSISEKEDKLNDLIIKRKGLQIQLVEINNFASNYNEDFYIDDTEIKEIFEKYKKGLGVLIEKDFKELQNFRNQILDYKDQLLKEKRILLIQEIEKIDSNIRDLHTEIQERYSNITSKKKSNFSKGLIIYKQKFSELQKHSSSIDEFEKQEEIKDESRKTFNEKIDSMKDLEQQVKEIKSSFQKTFVKIHEQIMGNSHSSFDFSFKPIFMVESFFQFSVVVFGQGSKGVNQMRAVIYDLSLLLNEHTKKKHLGFVIHDNLIFGSVDKDSSISTLNFLSEINADKFQYIATVNKDDFDYSELESKFTFKVKECVRIELTKSSPLFPNWKQ